MLILLNPSWDLILIVLFICLYADGFVISDLDPEVRSSPLYAKMNRLKGARQFTRDRPKKTRPSAIYPSPTLYYGNIQDYFGSPPEYTAIPVEATINLLRNGAIAKLIKLIKQNITAKQLHNLLSEDTSFKNELNNDINTLKRIQKEEMCDVTYDLVLYLDRVVNDPLANESFIDRLHTLKKLQKYWELREEIRYNRLLKQLFWRLRQIAFKMRDTGIPLEEFTTPDLWHKYGVFKNLPVNTMVETYKEKHKIALNTNIRNFYFRDPNTNEIHSILDHRSIQDILRDGNSSKEDELPCPDGSHFFTSLTSPEGSYSPKLQITPEVTLSPSSEGSSESPVEGRREVGDNHDEASTECVIPKDIVDRMVLDLQRLNVLDMMDCAKLNMSRVDEFQREYKSEDALHAYAIRDCYLSWKYNYKVEPSPYILESFINHNYRIKTLERDLLIKYKKWLKIGAPQKTPKPIGLKYRHLAIWHTLSKNKRRQLAQKYVNILSMKTS